ncbi:PREDICTED: glutathione [Prunus dulcis]|uniref:PREDICTED: glutathione n=1 Tax=Prunus dulcis TaxID=3755 RepID=A0A5E4EEG0_PRUDU|nr:PREDICTED: glutathione [Prunus dulcis]
MATIKVYGSTYSTVAMPVFAALYEKDIELEFVPVDMRAGEHKKEPIISLNVRNPAGDPRLKEDGNSISVDGGGGSKVRPSSLKTDLGARHKAAAWHAHRLGYPT